MLLFFIYICYTFLLTKTDYLYRHPELNENRLRILVTGHSLGAAGANLFGAWLNTWAEEKNIYVYTFATPNTICGNSTEAPSCMNIFNVVNVDDPIPNLPKQIWLNSDPWRKFGVTKAFSVSFSHSYGGGIVGLVEQAIKHHPPQVYINAVKSGAIGNNRQTGLTVIVACPVDVEIFNSSGALVGRIRNNTVDINTTGIQMNVIDDVKYFILTDADKYSFRLTATGQGTMQYAVQTFDYVDNSIVEQKVFSSVALVSGKQMSSEVSGGATVSQTKLFVVDSSGKPTAEVQPNGSETSIKYIFKTRYESTLLNWFLFIVCFGWLWMWFI